MANKTQPTVTKLKAEITKLKKENKKLLEMAQTNVKKSVKVVEDWLNEEFQRGYEAAYEDIESVQVAFDKHMDKAAALFEKELVTKVKKAAKPKAKSKLKSKAKVKPKKKTATKKRGRPTKK